MVEASEPHLAAEVTLLACVRCNRSGTDAERGGQRSGSLRLDGVRTRPPDQSISYKVDRLPRLNPSLSP